MRTACEQPLNSLIHQHLINSQISTCLLLSYCDLAKGGEGDGWMRAKYRRRSRRERSRPSRSPQSRHQPSDRLLGPLGFGVCCGRTVGVLGAIEAGMEHHEDIQAIQSHTEPSRATQGHTEPFRAIYQAIMCDISPSTVFSRRRSFPLLRTSIIVVVCLAVLSSSPSSPSPTHTTTSRYQKVQVPSNHHRCQVSWHLSHNAAPSTQLWQPSRQVVVFSGGYWLLWLPFT